MFLESSFYIVIQFSPIALKSIIKLKLKLKLPSPRYFFFSFPFRLLLWFWSFSGLRNLPFEAFSLKWLQISLRWFSKNRLHMFRDK